jgi:alpha-glucosidase
MARIDRSAVKRPNRREVVGGLAGALAAATLASPTVLFAEPSQTHDVGRFLVDIGRRSIRVRHQANPARSLWETAPGKPFLQAGAGAAAFREHGNPLGSFTVKDIISYLNTVERIESSRNVDAKTCIIAGELTGVQPNLRFSLTFRAVSESQLQFVIAFEGARAANVNRIVLRYASSSSEGFFGFGQQLTYFNQKGKLIPMLVQEHGVGRGLPVVTQLVDLLYDGAGGDPYITEAPAPQYITSSLRSLFLENREYSIFDMRADDFVELRLFSNVMTGRILYGETPLALIEAFTHYAGRMRKLPAWVHEGVMVCAQGGSAKVDALLTRLLDANVPICGLWVQDWSGTRRTAVGQQVLWNWELNTTHYPGWDAMVARLKRHGLRVFVYMNPFLVPTLCGSEQKPDCPSELYAEAERKGYFVKRNGSTFTYTNSSIRAGMVDLSNPAARAWWKALIKREVIGKAQASGWMSDFGEALPFDAELFGGADPRVWHNHYPEAWAGLHREAIDETGNGADFLFWSRSGFTQSPAVATAFWLGDQLQTWDEFDGIKTAVVGLLSCGISGFSLAHSDTGGFTAGSFGKVLVIARSKELLMRWMELNAFTAIFRTHEGLIPSISAQVDTDAQTIEHLARFARIYKCLGPYRKTLVAAAAANGSPVVRHLFLHYPDDPEVRDLRYQFMLGPDFLIAPVLDRGATRVRVYLPKGDWTELWSGRAIAVAKGRWLEWPAPLGEPGVFCRSGAASGEQLVSDLKADSIIIERSH